jgi:glutaminase
MELVSLTQTQLMDWLHSAKAQAVRGQVVQRISLLSKAKPDWFAVHLCWRSQTYSLGDVDCVFPLMSVIKPFVLLYLLEQVGADAVFQWVGMKPSDASFNSLEQLIADSGWPRNPMINSGAIALADQLPGKDATDRCHQFCQWLNQQAGCQLKLDQAMLASVRSAGREPNQAIAQYLMAAGRLNNLSAALDTYEQICCLSGQVADLANLANLLACEQGQVAPRHRQIVNALMLTCGLYEASAEWAVRVGLPMKSGVSGTLLAVLPGQGAIACYSPALDAAGNPLAGLAFVEAVAQTLQLSLFG